MLKELANYFLWFDDSKESMKSKPFSWQQQY